MATAYKLYGRSGSGSLAVQVALEAIGVPYECIWVSRETADVERLREVNPNGKVPVLMLPDGTVMFESSAMLIHLALVHPTVRLAPPPGTSRHALFLQWMAFLSANVYESVLRIYYSDRYSTRGEADAAAIHDQALADFCAHLEVICRGLAPYVLGSEYSIADVYLYMLAAWYPGEKTELYARLPALGRHAALLAARSDVAKAEADHA